MRRCPRCGVIYGLKDLGVRLFCREGENMEIRLWCSKCDTHITIPVTQQMIDEAIS